MRRFLLQAIAVATTWATDVIAGSNQDAARADVVNSVRKLGPKLSSNAQIILPSSEQFDEVTARWSLLKKPHVNVAVVPATENDVVEIVSWTNFKLRPQE